MAQPETIEAEKQVQTLRKGDVITSCGVTLRVLSVAGGEVKFEIIAPSGMPIKRIRSGQSG